MVQKEYKWSTEFTGYRGGFVVLYKNNETCLYTITFFGSDNIKKNPLRFELIYMPAPKTTNLLISMPAPSIGFVVSLI